MNISDIEGSYYCCIISLVSKNGAKNLLSRTKMGKEILTIGNIEIAKKKFYRISF